MSHQAMSWQRALVTGASSGIGLEMARLLAERGTALVLVARSEGALRELAAEVKDRHGIEAEVLVADLSDPADLEAVAGRVAQDAAPVDLVVNNAGFGISGMFGEAEWADEQRMLRLNVEALTRLSHAAVRAMAPRGRGGIVNVSSVGGFVPSYGFASYGATKAYVLSFSEALHEEVARRGIHVTCVAPGLTRTGFQAAAGNEADGMPEFLWQTPRQVAEEALAAVSANRAVRVTGVLNRATMAATRLVPRGAVRKVSAAVVRRF